MERSDFVDDCVLRSVTADWVRLRRGLDVCVDTDLVVCFFFFFFFSTVLLSITSQRSISRSLDTLRVFESDMTTLNLAGLRFKLNGLLFSPLLTTVTPGCLHTGFVAEDEDDLVGVPRFDVDDFVVVLGVDEGVVLGLTLIVVGDLNEFLKFSETRLALIAELRAVEFELFIFF